MNEQGREDENGPRFDGTDSVAKTPLERIADALEKLTTDPEVEIEMGPPLCPSCGKLNPVVELQPDVGGRGPMLEIVLHATCTHCDSALVIGIESFSVHQTIETLKEEIEARRAGYIA